MMKKIGKEVLFLAAGNESLRMGEGSFIRRKDNSIMLVYSDFCGDDWHDHCEAVISAIYSYDDGETWQDKKIIVRKESGSENIMSASLLRMNNGDIGLFYVQKHIVDGIILDKIYIRRSSDEGETWSEPYCCIPANSYFVVNNDRFIKLKSGRIIFPASEHKPVTSLHRPIGDDRADNWLPGNVSAFYSDDDGFTWNRSQIIYTPFKNDRRGLMEPGLYEREDGSLHLYIRTELGFQYECFSDDCGESWSEIQPNQFFVSPDSPMLIKKVGGKYTLAVFNPVAKASPCVQSDGVYWKIMGRTPYVCAVSEDDDQSYEKAFYIEDDLTNDYCYPAIIGGDNYFLIAYYHSNNTGVALNSLKVTKVMYDELN